MGGLRVVGMASSGGEALRVVGRYAGLGHPGLEWLCGSCAGRQECLADVSIGTDVYSLLLSIADVKVFRVVHVISDRMM